MWRQFVESVHHVGIAVTSIDAARTFYESILGATGEPAQVVASQGVRVAFFQVGHGPRLELLEPLAPDSPVGRFLQKRGPGLHHLAYQVRHLDQVLVELERAGVRLVDRVSRPGSHGLRVAFLHPSAAQGVLIELCEPLWDAIHAP